MKLALLLAIFAFFAATPAQAFELGRPYARVGLDVGWDDHVTMREAPDPASYPYGNRDAMSTLGLGASEEAYFDENRVLTLSARLKGTRYLNYGDFSGFWGSVTAELGTYHLWGDLDGFWAFSGGTSFTEGRTLGLNGTLEHPLPWDLKAELSLGAYGYWGTTGTDHVGTWGEAGLRRKFGPLALTAAGSLTRRDYGTILDLTGGPSLYATWQLYPGVLLKATLERLWTDSSDPTRIFAGNTASLGSVYYAF